MVATSYAWNPVFDCITKEADDAGATIAKYTREPKLYGGLISQRRSGVSSFYHYDAIGTTRALTNSSQATTDTAVYTAFGEKVASTGATVNPFGYVGALGYYTNVATNDAYVRARNYQPALARWITVDPIFLMRGNSAFEYAGNHPLSYSDPSGHWRRSARSNIDALLSICATLGGIIQMPEKEEELTCKQFVDRLLAAGPNDKEFYPGEIQENARRCRAVPECKADCRADGYTSPPGQVTEPCIMCFSDNIKLTLRKWIGLWVHESTHVDQYRRHGQCCMRRAGGIYRPIETDTCRQCETFEEIAYIAQAKYLFPGADEESEKKRKKFISDGICTSCSVQCANSEEWIIKCAEIWK